MKTPYNRNLSELDHWGKLKNKVDQYWLHHTPAGQERIKHKSGFIIKYVGRKKLNVLEIGAGNGWYSVAFAKTPWNLIVSDLSSDLLRLAKKKINMKKIRFKTADVYSLPFKNGSFDAVIGSSVLHHLDLERALPEISRVLKDKGKIAFCEPNMLNPQIALQKNIPYFKKRSGDSPDETAYFKWQIKKILKSYGFINVKALPVDFLHPRTPKSLIKYIQMLSTIFEKTPLVKEIAGSLFITGLK